MSENNKITDIKEANDIINNQREQLKLLREMVELHKSKAQEIESNTKDDKTLQLVEARVASNVQLILSLNRSKAREFLMLAETLESGSKISIGSCNGEHALEVEEVMIFKKMFPEAYKHYIS